MKMIEGIIFDFNRTLYDPERDSLTPGCKKLLDELRKLRYKMCLISRKTKGYRREQISRLGLDKYFEKILVIEGEKNGKYFSECKEVMLLEPSEVAVIGDRVESGIYIGNKLGMFTIWYKRGKFANILPKNDFQKPNRTVTNLKEVIKHLS